MHASDFPMSEQLPNFPHRAQVLQYLEQYASHFELWQHIRCNTKVLRVYKIGIDLSIEHCVQLLVLQHHNQHHVSDTDDKQQQQQTLDDGLAAFQQQLQSDSSEVGWLVELRPSSSHEALDGDDDGDDGVDMPGVVPATCPGQDSDCGHESYYHWFTHVVIASGPNQRPNIPHCLPFERFCGTKLHSMQYKHADDRHFRHKAVLVVGGGESAADLSNEISFVARTTYHSIRNGVWFHDRCMSS
jgi:cation diffusion facilitator CzcD-associated flavoprotein CzcO